MFQAIKYFGGSPHGASRPLTGILTTQIRSYTKKGIKANKSPKVGAVLLQDVEGLGETGMSVAVAHGRLRNQLLPSKQARYATPRERKELKALIGADNGGKEKTDSYTKRRDRYAQLFKNSIIELGQDNPRNLQLSALKLAEHFRNKLKIDINPAAILLESPINVSGTHTVPIQIDRDTTVNTTIVVKKWPRIRGMGKVAGL
ncbi:hypothetical protein SARC_07288 [Sphaeroforma arctica JP610]|uniref:50S ribosomal protein L9, chloroplastic n=1 Tax=Sphaeroforma arctica JP610 TaxID=667725 RepID=A0A0L0FWM3_9EUKA|nr:hypothetical protein SARC_07288 [Sphaeroforma arctica JP610]KNC80353.1 hypothetical protein SARC_07288 [Sphaeroforma arctica JP610]|eukprot:XP_014154255.1 hypothetical protein SARC_07288 [Sphaeroforma arctica JP610]